MFQITLLLNITAQGRQMCCDLLLSGIMAGKKSNIRRQREPHDIPPPVVSISQLRSKRKDLLKDQLTKEKFHLKLIYHCKI